MKILSVAVPSIFWEGLDYIAPADFDGPLLPGMRVSVPLASRKVVGILLSVKDSSHIDNAKLRHAEAVLDEAPWLSTNLLALLSWVSEYYHYPIGEVMTTALPKAFRQPKALVCKKPLQKEMHIQFESEHDLTQEQSSALSAIQSASGYHVFLLDGVTGSGKTEVYMHAINDCLQAGKQALLLVPEISLTPQTSQRFMQRFNVPVLMLHSGLAPVGRLQRWLQVTADVPLIVIGTRSAVFSPFANLGLIVVDEEHDLSYKQQTLLRYSARDVAIKRASDLHIPIILGSATPSFESYCNISQRNYHHLQLHNRVGQSVMPTIEVVDLRQQALQAGLSVTLIERMREHLERGQQVLLFLNRRGYSPVVLCHHCGWTISCRNCDANMVWHKQARKMVCHHCGVTATKPKFCQECGQSEVTDVGQGTERLDEMVSELFPKYKVLRIDRDSTRKKNSLEDIIEDIHQKEPCVLIGTQMIAKGHHFPCLSLVAIVDVDSGLYSVDFRSEERLAQLVFQVAGRAGRMNSDGEVLLQTHQPDNPFFKDLLSKGYRLFAESSCEMRKQINLPPYWRMVFFQAEAKTEKQALEFLNDVKSRLRQHASDNFHVMGPVAAPMLKRKGYFRVQLLLKAPLRSVLQAALKPVIKDIRGIKLARGLRWMLDIDPLEMM